MRTSVATGGVLSGLVSLEKKIPPSLATAGE
jgi:hypothetical protein